MSQEFIIRATTSPATMGKEVKFESFEAFCKAVEKRGFVQTSKVDKAGGAKQIMWLNYNLKQKPTDLAPITEKMKGKNGKEYDVVHFYKPSEKGYILEYAEYPNGAVRRVGCNIESKTCIFLDVDGVYDSVTVTEAYSWLKEHGISFLMYSSQGFDSVVTDGPNAGKTKRNFRVVIPVTEPIPTKDWNCMYSNLMNNILPFQVDPALAKPNQYIASPYKVDNRKTMLYYNIGRPMDTKKLLASGITYREKEELEKAKKAQERALRKEEKENYAQSEHTGSYDPSVEIISQIDFDKFDLEEFIDNTGVSVHSNDGDKIIFECPGAHASGHNNTEAFAIDNPGSPPTISCSHGSCQYNSVGATTEFLEEYSDCVNEEWIRGTYKKPPEVVFDFATEQNTSSTSNIEVVVNKTGDIKNSDELTKEDSIEVLTDGMTIEDNPLNFMSKDDKFSCGIYPTGFGKTRGSNIYAVNCVQKGEKVIVFVPNIKAMYDWMSDFKIQCTKRHVDFNKLKASLLHSENKLIHPDCQIVVTHYHYLKRRGHTNKLYSVVKWVEETSPVVIADEIDTIFSTLVGSVQLTSRYLKPKKIFMRRDVCPSRSSKRYMCDKCHMLNSVYIKNNHNAYQMEYPAMMTNHEYTDPDRINVSNNQALNNIESTHITYKSALHELTCSFLNQTGVTPLGIDLEDFNIHQPHGWIDEIVNGTTSPYLVSATEEDRKNVYFTLFNEASKEFDENNSVSKFKSVEDFEKAKYSYASVVITNKITKKEIQDYPYHACGVKWLHYLDTTALVQMIPMFKRVRMMTATITENQETLLNNIFDNKIEWYKGDNPDWKAIDNLLVITTFNEIDSKTFSKEFNKTANSLSKEIDTKWGKRKIDKTLLIEKSQKDFKESQKKDDQCSFYFENNITTHGEQISGQHWSLMRTYSRSSIARGTNLGEFSTAYVDFGSFKPMLHYNFVEDLSLDDAQRKEHVMLIKQAAGRIMRKAMDDNKESLEDTSNRFICIGGCFQEMKEKDENGKTITVDLSKTIANELHSVFNKMINNKIEVFALTDTMYWDEADMHNKILRIQKRWIEDVEFTIPKANIPNSVFNHKNYEIALKKNKKLSKFYDEDGWLIEKYIRKLDVIKKESFNINSRELQRKYNWGRLKQTVPSSVIESYNNLFEE